MLERGHANSVLKGRLRTMAETLAARRSELARLVSERRRFGWRARAERPKHMNVAADQMPL
ncbi:MAG: hypothetical protein ACLQIQ_15500 [Beijerinckiaceae bacterium]